LSRLFKLTFGDPQRPEQPEQPGRSLLWLLNNKRPDPVKKGKTGDQGKKTKQRKKYRKSVKLTKLRQLIEYFAIGPMDFRFGLLDPGIFCAMHAGAGAIMVLLRAGSACDRLIDKGILGAASGLAGPGSWDEEKSVHEVASFRVRHRVARACRLLISSAGANIFEDLRTTFS